MISDDDLTKAQSELSDEELEGVAGGIPAGILLKIVVEVTTRLERF